MLQALVLSMSLYLVITLIYLIYYAIKDLSVCGREKSPLCKFCRSPSLQPASVQSDVFRGRS